MSEKERWLSTPLSLLEEEYPRFRDFSVFLGMGKEKEGRNITAFLDDLGSEELEERGLDRKRTLENFLLFLEDLAPEREKGQFPIGELTVRGGFDKGGKPENLSLSVKPGEIITIVGPTGSGKSRLLGDIECLAQGDTPTGRKILLNGDVPSGEIRYSLESRLIAQLSQNMNFIMDLTVEEFVTMHGESRQIPHAKEMTERVLGCANELAGETFAGSTSVTALSGGQSRALMIADTALLSESPIVLIDEVENAGVDRKRALELLVREEKIVLISTHDPILALLGDIRLVIRNGGIDKIIYTTEEERKNLFFLEEIDRKLLSLRNRIRRGEMMEDDLSSFFREAALAL